MKRLLTTVAIIASLLVPSVANAGLSQNSTGIFMLRGNTDEQIVWLATGIYLNKTMCDKPTSNVLVTLFNQALGALEHDIKEKIGALTVMLKKPSDQTDFCTGIQSTIAEIHNKGANNLNNANIVLPNYVPIGQRKH